MSDGSASPTKHGRILSPAPVRIASSWSVMREARTRELARAVAPEKGPGLFVRLAAFARRRPATRPAAQTS